MSSTMSSTTILLTFLFHTLATGTSSTTFTFVNSCNITVYPGIFLAARTSLPIKTTTGFSLHSGESKLVVMPHSCSGHVWGRTNCFNNSKGGMFHCRTGDCASSTIECNGRDASQPATLAKFNLNVKSKRVDYFSVTVEKGYNLPMTVQPRVGKDIGDCMTTSCMVHLNKTCPMELKVMSERQCIGCKSPCQPLSKNCYSELTKACPQNATSVCASTDYVIEFCPNSTSLDKPVNNSGSRKKKGSTNNNIKHKLEKLLKHVLSWLKKHIPWAVLLGTVAAAATTAITAAIMKAILKAIMNAIMNQQEAD